MLLLYIIGVIVTAIAATFVFAVNTKDSVMTAEDMWFAGFLMIALACLWPASVPIIVTMWAMKSLFQVVRAYANGETKMPTISIKIND